MNNEAKEIIKLIAGIQIESLTALKRDRAEGNFIPYELLCTLLQIKDESINFAIDTHIQAYVEIEHNPNMIKLLPEYQLLVCSHILFKMEDEWITSNSQGVYSTWAILHSLLGNKHPEFSLLKL